MVPIVCETGAASIWAQAAHTPTQGYPHAGQIGMRVPTASALVTIGNPLVAAGSVYPLRTPFTPRSMCTSEIDARTIPSGGHLVAAGLIATVVCLASLAATGYDSAAVAAALIAALGYVAGAVRLVIAHRRVRAVEQRWLAEHRSVPEQPPTR